MGENEQEEEGKAMRTPNKHRGACMTNDSLQRQQQ